MTKKDRKTKVVPLRRPRESNEKTKKKDVNLDSCNEGALSETPALEDCQKELLKLSQEFPGLKDEDAD